MSREIKFKVWDKHYNRWEERPCAVNKQGVLFVYNVDEGHWFEPQHAGYTVVWFTGRKDKNGVEIYAGDKISFTVFDHNDYDTQYEGIVKFAHGEWQIWNTSDSEYYGADGAFSLFWVHPQDEELEVIGNIHKEAE